MPAFLDELNDPQREAVLCTDQPLLVLAGAGSGKTRTLTAKIAYLLSQGMDPASIMAVTFTNKAAREMRERLARLVDPGTAWRMQVSTFHSACVRFLRQEADLINLDPNFTIYDDGDQKNVVNKLLDELGIKDSRLSAYAVMNYISKVKSQLLDPETVASDHYHKPELAELYHKYQLTLEDHHAVDFDDLILRVVTFLTFHEDLRRHYQDRFQYLLVDEFQDTNPAQYRLVQLLMGGRTGIFVVGDDDQSIYSWRGADLEHVFKFEEDFPNTKTIRLEQNYRSTPQILDAANAVIEKNIQRKGKKLWTDRPPGVPVRLTAYRDDRDEARALATAVRHLRDEGTPLEDMAVLYRTNAMSRLLEEALRRETIPYRIVGGVGFYQRREIKDLMGYLKLLVNPMDLVALERIINVPRRGIGKTGFTKIATLAARLKLSPLDFSPEHLGELSATGNKLAPFVAMMREFREQSEQVSPLETVSTVLEVTGYADMIRQEDFSKDEQRMDSLEEFQSVIGEQLEDTPEVTFKELIDNISLYTDQDQKADGPALLLMTLHTAKGLEFPTVFMPGLEEGLMPHQRSLEDPSGIEEERRLMYVGMTRARQDLRLSYAQQRFVYNTRRAGTLSRFVREIPDGLLDVRDEAPAAASFGGYSTPRRDTGNPWGGGKRWSFGGSDSTHQSGPRTVQSVRTRDFDDHPVPTGQRLNVATGTRVVHPALGEGTVLAVLDDRVQVDFDDGKDRWLSWEFAQLSLAR